MGYFQNIALYHYNKYFFGKHTEENKRKYLISWYESMKDILTENNISKEEIINL